MSVNFSHVPDELVEYPGVARVNGACEACRPWCTLQPRCQHICSLHQGLPCLHGPVQLLSLHRRIWNDADSSLRNTRGQIAAALTARNTHVPGDALVRVVWLIYEYLFAPPVRVRMYALSGATLASSDAPSGGEKRSIFAGLPVDDAGLLSVDHWRQWLVAHRFYLPDNAGGTEFLMKMCADDRFTVAHFRALMRENPSFNLCVTRRVRPDTSTAASATVTAAGGGDEEDGPRDAAFAVDLERRTHLLLAFTRRRPGSGPFSATTQAVFRYLVYHTRTRRLPPLVAGVLLQNSDPVMRSLADQPIADWPDLNDGGGGGEEEPEGDAKTPVTAGAAASITIGKQLFPVHLLGTHVSANDCHIEPVDTPLAVCKKHLRHTMLECRIL